MSHSWREIKHVGFGTAPAIAGVAVAGEAIAGTGYFLDAASKGAVTWSEEVAPSPSWSEVTGG